MKFLELRGKALIAIILMTSGLDFLLFGYDQGLFGGILGGDRFKDTLGRPNPTMTGLVTAIYDIGCALGAVVAFVFGERIGRKRSIILANVIVIVGAAIQTASFEYWQMFVARIIGGVGVVCAHHYWSCDRVVALFCDIICRKFAAVALSRCVSDPFLGTCPVSMPFLCETPRWLAQKGKIDEAKHVISRLLDKPLDDDEVIGQLQEILTIIEAESQLEEPSWSEVFSNNTKTRNLHRVILGMGPYLFNQWSGVNALCYYLAVILQDYLGYSPSMSLILASVAFTQYALFSWPPYFYIDRIGRRMCVMLSSAGCAACMAIIAGTLANNSFSSAAAAVAFMFLFLDCFTLGILPVSWSYSAEIQPLRVRNKATAVGVFSHWMSNFVVVMVTPIGLSSIRGHYFWVWAVVCASFVPLTYFFGVETSGRSLEQIDEMFWENSRVCMGLNPENRRVVRASRSDEEERYRTFAKGGEKVSVEMREDAQSY
ncbi:hypothetical protein HBH72_078450 [Parastagonospora nodorum]|nr:hypothetical protein HBH72_078450 [Parastagonospora nodorum]